MIEKRTKYLIGMSIIGLVAISVLPAFIMFAPLWIILFLFINNTKVIKNHHKKSWDNRFILNFMIGYSIKVKNLENFYGDFYMILCVLYIRKLNGVL